MGARWTKAEDDILRQHLNDMGARRVFNEFLPYRTYQAVRQRGRLIGAFDQVASARRRREILLEYNRSAECREQSSKRLSALNANMLAWCPPVLRAEYNLLRLKVGAKEARRIIQQDADILKRKRLDALFRAQEAPVGYRYDRVAA